MAKWHDKRFIELNVACAGDETGSCHFGPVSADRIASDLKSADERWRKSTGQEGAPFYAYGDHVSDPQALLLRYLTILGWKTVVERSGDVYQTSTKRMCCPLHQKES